MYRKSIYCDTETVRANIDFVYIYNYIYIYTMDLLAGYTLTKHSFGIYISPL